MYIGETRKKQFSSADERRNFEWMELNPVSCWYIERANNKLKYAIFDILDITQFQCTLCIYVY